jgi:small nuclear ribonucleoprotein (snRNP)-like protein
MAFSKKRRPFKSRPAKERIEFLEPDAIAKLGSTGAEAAYFRSSIDSRATVTVVLSSGERLRGRIRYFDRDCFSIGLVPRGPNVLIRKSSVLYISEE